MRLKYCILFILGLSLAGLLAACNADHTSENQGFMVTGSIPGLADGRAVLMKLDLNTNEPSMVDTTLVDAGKFVFVGKLDQPYVHTIKFIDDGDQKIHLFLENSVIDIEGVAEQMDQVKISGSREDSLFHSFELDDFFDRDSGVRIMFDHSDYVFGAFVAYYQFQLHNFGPDTLSLVMDGFSENVKASVYYDHLVQLAESINRVKIGQPAPDFRLPDRQGNLVSLGEFAGQYVLIDFWASWCPPCRAENPKLRQVYSTFASRGFEIVGISVDTDGDKWRQAIMKDEIDWVHVSQLDGWGDITTLYGVKAIPQSFLIGPAGVIIAKNLTLENLAEQLDQVLPN